MSRSLELTDVEVNRLAQLFHENADGLTMGGIGDKEKVVGALRVVFDNIPEHATFRHGRPHRYLVNDVRYQISPTSCRCGGSWAWMKQRESGAWEMVGCVCHTLPTGQRIVNETMPPAGDAILVDKVTMQALVDVSLSVIKPVVAQLRRLGVLQ